MPFFKGQLAWNKGIKLPYEVWNKGKKGYINKGSFKIGQNVGRKSSSWKGDNVGYYGLHTYIRKTLGRANHCINPKCIYPRKDKRNKLMLAPKRYEWSNISGTYRRDPSDWQQLCASCHRLYDYHNLNM